MIPRTNPLRAQVIVRDPLGELHKLHGLQQKKKSADPDLSALNDRWPDHDHRQIDAG